MFARALDPVLFRDDRDYSAYLALLARAVDWMGWRCLSYCLMPNHVHLLLETPEPNLGAGMCRLHGDFAQSYNRRHRRRKYVFERRYGSRRIRDDTQLLTLLPYIALNPVKKELCERPEQWPWSSHGGVIAERSPWWVADERLMAYVEGITGGERPREHYAELCAPRTLDHAG